MNFDEFRTIKTISIPSLQSKSRRFVAYKNISIHGVLPEITLPGDWLQFGVFQGQTAKILESFILPERKLHLFDSFEGLPENWTGTGYDKGHFAMPENEIPRFDPSRTIVHKGWFEETIEPYKALYTKPVSFIHCDADLYSSTKTILNGLNDQIIPGTILLFDEFFLRAAGSISDEEARAFFDWAESHDRLYQFLWRTEHAQCAVKILR